MIKEKIHFLKELAFPLVCIWIVASSMLAIGAEVVKASSDGQFLLLPSTANFEGGSRITGGVGGNLIGYLNRPESMATWDLEVLDSGTYRVELLYAMIKSNQTRIEIKTSGGIVFLDPEANSSRWSDLKTDKEGVIVLKKGRDSLRIRSIQNNGWANIGEIRLIPFTLIPVDVLKFVKAYHSQKEKIDQQTKADYVSIIRKRQKVFVQKEQFDEVGGLEKEIKRIEGMEVEELFGKGGGSPTDDATVKLLSEYRGKWIFARQGLRDKYVMALKRAHLKYEKGSDLGISKRVKELIREPEVKPVDLEMEETKASQVTTASEEKASSQKVDNFDSERAILGKWVAEKEDTHITFFKSGNLSCPSIKEINMPRMIKYYLSYGTTFRLRGRSYKDYAYVTLDAQSDTVKLRFEGKIISFKREETGKSSSKASSEN